MPSSDDLRQIGGFVCATSSERWSRRATTSAGCKHASRAPNTYSRDLDGPLLW